MTASAVAAVACYSAYWVGQIAKRYNADGPDGTRDRRHATCAVRPDLPASHLPELAAAVAGPHPEGDRWCVRTVAQWLAERLGRHVGRQLGWRYLRRLGAHWLKPRPRYVRADSQAQAAFRQHLRPLLRQVATAFRQATAFPQATVELWAWGPGRPPQRPQAHPATGLGTTWAPLGQRPVAAVQHRYEWRCLVGFVHAASGRTVFHLWFPASTVNISLFGAELAAFAAEVGAGSRTHIALILDRAGWHASVHVRVPEHVTLLFPAFLAAPLPEIPSSRPSGCSR